MSLVKRVTVDYGYTGNISNDFYNMMNDFHSRNYYDNYEIESLLLKQQELDTAAIKNRLPKRKDIVVFNPSSAGKCPRELYYKGIAEEEGGLVLYPYNRRWALNGTVVHSRIQRDLLYAERFLDSNPFSVARAKDILGDNVAEGRSKLPAWENNVLTTKEFEHNGEKFAIRGMCDGYLWHEDKLVNLEIKTKSTTIAAVGTFKMKEPMLHHVKQCICYSLLFMGNPYENRTDVSILYYESLAKDGWTKGAEARSDIRTFQVNVDKEMRVELLDKFSNVTRSIHEKQIPASEPESCLFCNYKNSCSEVEI